MKSALSSASEDPNDKSLMRFCAVSWVSEQHRRGYPLALCFRQAASRPWPDLTGQYYSARTLEDWYYNYQSRGFQALCGKTRHDKGKSKTISEELGEWLIGQLNEHSAKIPLSALYQVWLDTAQFPLRDEQAPPSLASIYRYLRARGIHRQLSPEARCGARKAFETGQVNDLWMVDFSPGPYLPDPQGKPGRHYQTHLCVVIDDHSRLVPYAAYYQRAHTAAFHDCLKNALRKRGLPEKLYTDNGKPFVSRHSKQICARLGIHLLHARPYHSWSKGKVEKMIGSIQTGFESTLSFGDQRPITLSDLNEALHHWLDKIYHQRQHRSTKQRPIDRYLQALHKGQLRSLEIEDPQQLERRFYLKDNRKVRSDGTIQLGGRYYEVRLDLKGLTIEIHYDPLTLKHIEVWYRNHQYGEATPVDHLLNSQIDWSQESRSPGSASSDNGTPEVDPSEDEAPDDDDPDTVN